MFIYPLPGTEPGRFNAADASVALSPAKSCLWITPSSHRIKNIIQVGFSMLPLWPNASRKCYSNIAKIYKDHKKNRPKNISIKLKKGKFHFSADIQTHPTVYPTMTQRCFYSFNYQLTAQMLYYRSNYDAIITLYFVVLKYLTAVGSNLKASGTYGHTFVKY